MLLLILLMACARAPEPAPEPSPDAYTSATPQVPTPVDGPTWSILQAHPALTSFVVRYDEQLLRSGEPTGPEGVAHMASLGVKTAITPLEDPRHDAWAEAAGITLVHIPFDKASFDLEHARAVEAAITDHPGPWWVYCHGGRHRAGAMAMVYRMRVQGWTWDAAALEMGMLGGDLVGDRGMIEVLQLL